MLRNCILATSLMMLHACARSQTVLPLYKGSIPNSIIVPDEEKTDTSDGILRIAAISRPTLTVYLPPKESQNGTAIIVCPGGGYAIAAAGHEGADVAKALNEKGITAFVLKYRMPSDKTMKDKSIGPLQDAQRALQMVREGADAWGIKKDRIGIMGFSAGGHLASTAGTHFQKAQINNPKNTSLRPDFMVLVYPVISFTDSIGHTGSRDNLLGKNASAEKIKLYSNEMQVTAQTPPTFLVHAKDDWVKVANTYRFAEALKKNGVAAGMQIYEKGGHGYGLINKESSVRWLDEMEKWLRQQRFVK